MQNSQSIFDPTGDLFFPSLYSCLVLIAVIFFIGLTAEVLFFKSCRCPKKRRKKGKSFNCLLPFKHAHGKCIFRDRVSYDYLIWRGSLYCLI